MEPENLLALYGRNDENLNLIEDVFKIKIAAAVRCWRFMGNQVK